MKGKRLLVIDDEPEIRNWVRRVAERLDYEVRLAADGEEFQKAYEQWHPTTIVLDIIMPGMDGMELASWLSERRCTAKIIIVTGHNPLYARAIERFSTMTGSMSAEILTKPIQLAELRAALG